MEQKEYIGRIEMVETAKQTMVQLGAALHSVQRLLNWKSIYRNELRNKGEFPTNQIKPDSVIKDLIRKARLSKQSRPHFHQMLEEIQKYLSAIGNEPQNYEDWTLGELENNIYTALEELSVSVAGYRVQNHTELQLLCKRLKEETDIRETLLDMSADVSIIKENTARIAQNTPESEI